MGLAKTELFTTEQNKLASLLKALAHPARIAILQHIIQSNTCICGDLVTEIGLAQPTISQHLKELKNSGLIKGTIEGTSVCYCIDEQNWNIARELINSFFNQNSNSADCC
ncbi:ArsR/SmtB family transcription factor [Aurantibacter aestuarii]|uniref:Transcriptional regulator n=1 Tax=Aurantibacter aestuarii TaxID=1266046 RepID=A0A2T1N8X7_9FLAO|nr:metalloregulator ArsR/SmtB family transcription factor [Aurantibacter aestuarii]PSG88330.1 transcriptional regulator [Aurantibacter aestuarii]